MVEDYQTIEKAGEVGEGYNENKEMGAQNTSLMKQCFWKELCFL